jgi:hypothetical protein
VGPHADIVGGLAGGDVVTVVQRAVEAIHGFAAGPQRDQMKKEKAPAGAITSPLWTCITRRR